MEHPVDDLGMVTLPFCERELKILVNALRGMRRAFAVFGHRICEDEEELWQRLERELNKIKSAKAQRNG